MRLLARSPYVNQTLPPSPSGSRWVSLLRPVRALGTILQRCGIGTLIILGISTPARATPRGKRPPRVFSATGSSNQLAVDVNSNLSGPAAYGSQGDGVGRPGPQCRVRDALTYHGGALVLNPDVVLIFWGSQWLTDQVHIDARVALGALYQQIGTSQYACSWGEYAVGAGPVGAGTYDPQSPDIISTAPPLQFCHLGDSQPQLCDQTIQQQIVAEATAGHVPAPTDNTVYVVVPPQDVAVEASDGSTGCGGTSFYFCGYHDSFIAAGHPNPFRYAVLPFPCTSGQFTCFFDSQQTPRGSLQIIGSHELAEIATDPDAPPVGARGWFSDRTLSENADICESFSCQGELSVGAQTFPVNSLWSNLAKGCVDSVPCAAPTDCTEGPPGECVQGLGNQNQCGLEWIVYPDLAAGLGGLPGRTVSCTDGQPFCDFDSVAGQCTFHVAACLNNADQERFPGCTPTSVTAIRLLQPSPTSFNGTDQGNAGRILSALSAVDHNSTGNVAGAQVTYSPAAATANTCTGEIDIVVPLHPVGARTLRGQRALNLFAQTPAGLVRNRLMLICNPGPF
jgi:hypothetical protein